MRERAGLPIAAYLGLLVALALASAFVAVVAIVIWLPPRPPDVMRTDIISDHFVAGYQHMTIHGRPLADREMEWRVQRHPPREVAMPSMRHMQGMLAHQLHVPGDHVRFSAARVARTDMFVVRVREAADARREADEARREGERIAREALQQRREFESELRVFEQELEAGGKHAGHAPAPPAAPGAIRAPDGEATPPVPPAPPAPPAPTFIPAPAGVMLISGFEIGAQLPDGRWLVMRQGRNWAELGWIGRATLVIGGTLLLLSLLAAWFARRLTRPIRNFSEAVQAVGVDPQSEPVREEGPRELRGAARAVNSMQARLRALIADRTKTLAAVAHDMRTPLMRLRLQAENASPEQRERMAKEIAEVEALVASFIAFARDDPAEEARVRLDLAALLQSIADDHSEAGRDVSFTGEERFIITGQSLGLKRVFSNLVDNALKYGASARITLRREDGAAVIDVEDDGPGIPADQRESVFEPFVRLNEEGTRGAGLGLAAARSIARAHGGDIVVLDAAQGALLRVTLPA